MVIELTQLLDSFSVTQYVKGPTREHGHTLDLMLSLGLYIDSIDYEDPIVSDHKPSIFNFTSSCQPTTARALGCPFRSINSSTSGQFNSAAVSSESNTE